MRIIKDTSEKIIKCPACKSIFAYNNWDIGNDFIQINGIRVKNYTGASQDNYVICPCCQTKLYLKGE